MLQAAAAARAEGCTEEDRGADHCKDAAVNLRVANAYLGAWQRDAAEQQAVRERQKRREAQEEALIDRLREEDERRREEKSCDQKQVETQAAADKAAQQARDFKLAYLKLLSTASRARKLSDCYAEHTECWDVVRELLDSAASESEKKSIAELNERLLHAKKPSNAARSGQATAR